MAKLTTEERRKFLWTALEEQRHLLRGAIEEMKAGDLTRALDVAVRIRVLVHEGMGKPLLKSLDKNYLQLPILHDDVESKHQDHVDGTYTKTITMPTAVAFRNGHFGLSANLGLKTYKTVQLGQWWSGIVLDLPGLGCWRRNEVVLGVAHKKGGAHVDTDISAKFKTLLDGKFVQLGVGDQHGPKSLSTLDMSRLITGKSGVELLDCLDNSFPTMAAAAPATTVVK